jgi:hypothetical protein
MFRRFSTAFTFLFIAYLSTALAQTSRGTLVGTVADSSGAVIPKAIVRITQQETGISRETVTNSAGIYRFDAVDLGAYSVSAQAPGFSTQDKKGIEILAAHTTTVPFSMNVGASKEVVTVEATGVEVGLQVSEQVHSETFSELSISKLPVIGGDSLTLAQAAPGVSIGSLVNQNAINQNGTLFFAVNGQRPRGNNFMIDGVENNDISVTGPAFTISNPDTVQQVNIQTADFSAEFGRAGGAIFNQITKSGTNQIHGSASWVYTGSSLQALNHLEKLGGLTSVPRQVINIPDFTIGGPVVIPGLYDGHEKTFFFGAAQFYRLSGNTTSLVRVPDEAGVATLQLLAPQCPNAALYLKALGSLRGDPNASPAPVSLQVPAGGCNGTTRAGMFLTTGLATRVVPLPNIDNNYIVKIDHTISQKQSVSFRWLYDKNTDLSLNNLPGFDNDFAGTTLTGLLTHTYIISPRWTNEFRFNYGRISFDFEPVTADAFHLDLPNYSGLGNGITGFGGATNIPQFRIANNWQWQDTMTVVRGTHTFRFGGDFLWQLASQHPPFNDRGSFVYSSSTGVTGFANFLDDFGGRSGNLQRQFGVSIYYPDLFRQSYFFQDSWKTTQELTLNLGLRYEYFGSPENTFSVPGFTNYDPVNFAAPNKIPSSKLNLGPSVGFAWNPRGANWFDHALGGEKTVWRGGFQISYDSSFNNLLSNIAGSSPNTLGGLILSPAVGRGSTGFSALFAGIQPTPPTALSPQNNLFLGSFPNPQTDRWSLGFQRELPAGIYWETSYVGSVSHHLYRSLDMNPIIDPATNQRLHPDVGQRTVRAASGNSNYESLQVNLKRAFKPTLVGRLQIEGSYTYSHFLDDVSDVFNRDSTPSSFESAPQILGFSPHLDYGDSDFDRRHVGALTFLWTPPEPKNGLLGQILGGWTFSGISHWQTGMPYTLQNGTDRGGYGQLGAERPDVSNPNAPLNTRAILAPSCATGFTNPDGPAGNCVDPGTVHWIEGVGAPNARTVGRNTLRAPGIDNLDFSVAKRARITEKSALEYRVDMFNAFNSTNLGFDTSGFVARTVNGSGANTFLDFGQTDSIGRSIRMRLRFEF